ncbi:MAG: cellulase family glycosylhydrolase [Pirellulales bacterium]
MRLHTLKKLLVVLIIAALAAAHTREMIADETPLNFITRHGDQLLDGDRPFRFISFNIPNLMVQEDAYEFTSPNPWRWPDAFEIEDALESVRQQGGQVVRTYTISVFRDGSDMGETVHVRRPGKFNEEAFQSLDRVLEVARRKGIRVIIPLVDQWKWWGGVGEYAAFRGKRLEEFWNDPQLIEDFTATVKYVLTRKNTLTGVEYRNDPAVFGWETGNEILPTPEWTQKIAAYIKELDKNHLVLDGKSLQGVPTASLDDPNIDVITSHHYPWGDEHDLVKPIRAAHEMVKGKKAYFVGEFGFVETPHIKSAIQTVIDDGTSGALLWSLRMHRREGGFYWHMEVGTGRNIYKAFHWPGFASGDRYDEREVMALMRAKAFEIRGIKPPAIEVPAAPQLLPIERVSAISWQGSAGASGYDVQRASAADGPFETIAANISDAEVQYRPLYNDTSAVPGREYRYRVIARNSAGASRASNVVGPVKVTCQTLVDECRDLSLTAEGTKLATPASENARTVQEDCHRLALEPGAEVVYRVARPLRNFAVYCFGPNETKLEFAASNDGKTYEPITAKSRSYGAADTVYGYSTPILFVGTGDGQATILKITLPADAQTQDATTQQAEATKAKTPAVELSRVEIEYGAAEKHDSRQEKAATPVSAATNPIAATAGKHPVQLNSAIFVGPGHSVDRTLAAIEDAAKHGERQLNVVVSVLVDLTQDLRVKRYGLIAGDPPRFTAYDESQRESLRDSLQRVFARMVEHDMAIYVLPHIDAGGKVYEWRNWVDFDPLAEHEGYSYSSLVLNTIAEALAKTVQPTTHVELSLSGEMGTSLFKHPAAYRQIVRDLKSKPELNDLKVGFSLNHNKIAGQQNPNGSSDIVLDPNSRPEMQALIDECDFIGFSCYVPVSVPPTAEDFVRGVNKFIGQFEELGLKVPNAKPLQFSEAGIGGRDPRDETVTPEKAAEMPWDGSGSPRSNPWQTAAMKKLRQQYHEALLEFLAKQPANWPVTAAFFWSTGSWDPWGHSHPIFADDTITQTIERHNRSVRD